MATKTVTRPDRKDLDRMLALIWERSQALVRERLQTLSHTAQCVTDGTLTDAARHAAGGEAHKLTGSLGMFGFPAASDAARELEQHLDSTEPADAARISRLVDSLCRQLDLKL